jgi:hypothetical protein
MALAAGTDSILALAVINLVVASVGCFLLARRRDRPPVAWAFELPVRRSLRRDLVVAQQGA